ncbi:MAG TPA: FAD-binding oxidoreductase [Solirubrobacteraceae bacterium]|nr:FAD-binding oxidoreductase [Solirubrobacteraceae bacterium]
MLSTYALADKLKGRVIRPDDADYDKARTVFYGAIDRRPALIARVADADDVARVIAHARESDLELAVRGGGHSPAGYGVSDGVVIDLSEMTGLEIDPAGRSAWAEGGVTAGQYTVAAGEHGLATGFGDTGSVGVGGITLSGGVGFLVRKHGLTIDSLLAAEVVTADGELVYTDADNHPDLFWAIRGGGGNFGVVTRLRFRLHEVSTVVGGMLILPATPDVIEGFVAEAFAAPEELSAIGNVMKAPPMPFLPPEVHGRLVVMALMAYAGDAGEGMKVVDRFRALAEPMADMIRPMPYPDIYPPESEDYHPIAIARTMFANGVGPAKAETIVERIGASTAMMAVTQLRVLGGAMASVPADATAFAHRRSRMMVNVAAMYERPEEHDEHAAWVDDLAPRLHDGDDGAYAGFLADEGEKRVRAAYPGATWDRLAAVKATYDRDNVFRLNQNVPPAG